MISICAIVQMTPFKNSLVSGILFYLTNDPVHIKTMEKAEANVLVRMLPAYYNHVRAFENTLITKIFGLYCVKLTGTA